MRYLSKVVFLLVIVQLYGTYGCAKWEIASSVNDGPYTDSNCASFKWHVNRTSSFCSADLRTRKTEYKVAHSEPKSGWTCRYNHLSACTDFCNGNTAVTVNPYCESQVPVPETMSCSFQYTKKSCNQYAWGSWFVSVSCPALPKIENSPSKTLTRKCLDCDDIAVNEKYCVASNIIDTSSTKTEACTGLVSPTWTTWVPQTCIVNNPCDGSGRQTWTRKCTYSDGTQASATTYCSQGVSSEVRSCNVVCTTSAAKTTTTPKVQPVSATPQPTSGSSTMLPLIASLSGFAFLSAVGIVVLLCKRGKIPQNVPIDQGSNLDTGNRETNLNQVSADPTFVPEQENKDESTYDDVLVQHHVPDANSLYTAVVKTRM
ncbi:uncharacterized protein LOC144747205 [Ciona intestinalis]